MARASCFAFGEGGAVRERRDRHSPSTAPSSRDMPALWEGLASSTGIWGQRTRMLSKVVWRARRRRAW